MIELRRKATRTHPRRVIQTGMERVTVTTEDGWDVARVQKRQTATLLVRSHRFRIVPPTAASEPTPEPDAADELDALSFRELQQRAKGLGLSGGGGAAALRERIRAAG